MLIRISGSSKNPPLHIANTLLYSSHDNISDCLSLSTIVLNSRDWYEIIWLQEISRFKNQPYNRFYPTKPAGMH